MEVRLMGHAKPKATLSKNNPKPEEPFLNKADHIPSFASIYEVGLHIKYRVVISIFHLEKGPKCNV